MERKSKIKIKWKNNGNQDVTFHAEDTDNDGYLDYVEWTVPHLSDQTFEIIFISKAFQLDQTQNIVADIYSEVQTQDNIFATVPQNNYIRTTFDSVLNNTKDITIYAKATDPNIPVSINVFPVYTDSDGNQTEGSRLDLVSDGTDPDFSNISSDGKYRILLQNLQTPTDVFDLKIIGGSIDIDYIVDPSCSCASSPCTLTATCTLTVPTGVTSVQVECWGGGQSGLAGQAGTGGIGGVGGSYAKKNSVTIIPGNSYTVTVGTGGDVCSATATPNNGNDSWFSTSGTVLAKGGGSSSSNIGDTTYTGGNGGSGFGSRGVSSGGGGGSSAGTGSNGVNGTNGSSGVGLALRRQRGEGMEQMVVLGDLEALLHRLAVLAAAAPG